MPTPNIYIYIYIYIIILFILCAKYAQNHIPSINNVRAHNNSTFNKLS